MNELFLKKSLRFANLNPCTIEDLIKNYSPLEFNYKRSKTLLLIDKCVPEHTHVKIEELVHSFIQSVVIGEFKGNPCLRNRNFYIDMTRIRLVKIELLEVSSVLDLFYNALVQINDPKVVISAVNRSGRFIHNALEIYLMDNLKDGENIPPKESRPVLKAPSIKPTFKTEIKSPEKQMGELLRETEKKKPEPIQPKRSAEHEELLKRYTDEELNKIKSENSKGGLFRKAKDPNPLITARRRAEKRLNAELNGSKNVS